MFIFPAMQHLSRTATSQYPCGFHLKKRENESSTNIIISVHNSPFADVCCIQLTCIDIFGSQRYIYNTYLKTADPVFLSIRTIPMQQISRFFGCLHNPWPKSRNICWHHYIAGVKSCSALPHLPEARIVWKGTSWHHKHTLYYGLHSCNIR